MEKDFVEPFRYLYVVLFLHFVGKVTIKRAKYQVSVYIFL